MHDQSSLRYNLHSEHELVEGSPEDTVDWYYATIHSRPGELVARSPMYPWASARDLWVSETKATIADLSCAWCGQPSTRISEIANPQDIIGWCDDDLCYTEAMREAHESEMTR